LHELNLIVLRLHFSLQFTYLGRSEHILGIFLPAIERTVRVSWLLGQRSNTIGF